MRLSCHLPSKLRLLARIDGILASARPPICCCVSYQIFARILNWYWQYVYVCLRYYHSCTMHVEATFSKATRNVDSCVLSGPSSSSWVVDCACMHASTSSRKGCCHWRPVLGGATPLQGREIRWSMYMQILYTSLFLMLISLYSQCLIVPQIGKISLLK